MSELEHLGLMLAGMYSPNAEQRKNAEKYLVSGLLEHGPESCRILFANLLQLLLQTRDENALAHFGQSGATVKDLRVGASIIIKNNVRKLWDKEAKLTWAEEASADPSTQQASKYDLLTDNDRNAAKHMLVEILLQEKENTVRKLLSDAFRTVVEFDYPEKYFRYPTIYFSLSHIYSYLVLLGGLGYLKAFSQIFKATMYFECTTRSCFSANWQSDMSSNRSMRSVYKHLVFPYI